MSDDDFLSRWSRRKRAVAEEAQPEPQPEPPATVEEPKSEEEEEALLAKLDLPVPETLQPGDDFSKFMADGVPEFLRKRALRVLWRSNPVLANLDGLNDYDEDFTSPELTQKVLATAYQVGRGFVSQAVEPAPSEPEDEVDDIPAIEDETEPESPPISVEIQAREDATVYSDEDEPAPRPRRMRFKS